MTGYPILTFYFRLSDAVTHCHNYYSRNSPAICSICCNILQRIIFVIK